MCFLIGKDFNKIGSIALQMEGGQHLVDFTDRLDREIGHDRIQLVTISRPSAFGEYEPYRFVDTEEEFEVAVKAM